MAKKITACLYRLISYMLGSQCLIISLFICQINILSASTNSSYRKGLQHYTKGEFDKAINQLHNAMKQKPSLEERTNIYKYIGLSLFTLGRKAEAERNFQQCINQDKACSISKNEALDETVLPFFLAVKQRMQEKDKTLKPTTQIIVQSPIKNVEILLDGILLGPANSPLDVKPGTIQITLQAAGYRPRTMKLLVNKNTKNVYQAQLEKIPPKPKPKTEPQPEVKVERKLVKKPKPPTEHEEMKTQKQDERTAKQSKKDRNPGYLPDETRSRTPEQNDLDRMLSESDPELKNGSEEKFSGKESTRNRREKFNREDRPSSNNNYGVNEERSAQSMVYTKSDPIPYGAENQAVPADNNRMPITPLHFLPLGIGQFYNGDFLLGTFILGTQVTSIALIAIADQDIVQAQKIEKDSYSQAETDPSISDQDLLKLSESSRQYIADKEDRINFAIGAGLGSWGLGVVLAIVMRPSNAHDRPDLLIPKPSDRNRLSWQLRPTLGSGYELRLHYNF
ncbi:MAG: PEGA domain-containing protein [Proteobacteria bacterium]|nr:PEGA domain-containing protein [Pseudomonadota bacterium]